MSFTWHEEQYRGYTIKIEAQDDAGNPLTEFDELLTIVLHDKAQQRFGWTTDPDYARLLNHGMENVRTAKNLGQAIEIVSRWLRVFHDVRVTLPISAYDHSGVSVSLGVNQGWDSGWVGLAIDTPARRKVMGFDDEGAAKYGTNPDGHPWNSAEAIEAALRQDFKTFQAWVQNEVVGYVIEDTNGDEIEDGSCWGYYGDNNWRRLLGATDDPYMISEAKGVIDAHINDLHAQAIAEDRDRCEAEAWALHDHINLYRKLVITK